MGIAKPMPTEPPLWVKIAALMVVSAETHTITATSTAPLSPATRRIASAATALESRMPPRPSAAR